jgi:glutathione peroxidase
VTTKYDIDFPMFSKIDVNGDGAAELFTVLKDQRPGEDDSSDIKWNFEKFLVNGEGNAVARWGTAGTPEQLRAELGNNM